MLEEHRPGMGMPNYALPEIDTYAKSTVRTNYQRTNKSRARLSPPKPEKIAFLDQVIIEEGNGGSGSRLDHRLRVGVHHSWVKVYLSQ